MVTNGLAHLAVVEFAAAANGLLAFRLDVRRTTDGIHQDLLDQACAGPAGAGGLGVLLHVVDGKQAVFLDRLDDGALAYAVAAADFHAIGHGHGLVLTLVAGVADGAFAKHQVVANLRHVVIFTNLTEIPAAIGRVAVQAGADEDVVLDHQLLVDAADGVGKGDRFRAFAANEVSGGKQVDAGDLELGRGDRAEIARKAEHRQVVGANFRLFEQRGDQAVGGATMVGALANGIHARIVGLQGVVDQDSAVAGNAGFLDQRAVRADAGGHYHEIGIDHLAIGEAHGADTALRVSDQLGGLLLHLEAQATAFERLLQQGSGGLVQLAFHRPLADVHHGHPHATQLQAVGRFQAQQAAADDHGVLVGLGGVHHRLGIGDVAVTDYPVELVAGNRQDEGVGAGRDEQAVVFGFAAVFGDDAALGAIDLYHLAVEHQPDVVLGIPVEVVEYDLLEGLLTREDRRKQDAVVVGMGLGTEHGDVVEVGGELEQFFQGANPGHAVADHHQFEFFHAVLRAGPAADCCLAMPLKIQQRKRRPTGYPVRTPLSLSSVFGARPSTLKARLDVEPGNAEAVPILHTLGFQVVRRGCQRPIWPVPAPI